MKRRVVITGIGVISPIGIGKEHFWDNLFAGKAGFRPITLFETSDFKVKIAGEITDFKAEGFLGKKGLRDLDRSAQLLCSAAKLAIEDANLEIGEKNNKKISVSVGTTFGSINSVSEFYKESLIQGPRFVNPSRFPNSSLNALASRLGIRLNIKGFNNTICTGICSAIDALSYAVDNIILERADAAIIGSVEELCLEIFSGFYRLKYLSGLNGKTPISCPFDKRRNGIILSEGATVLVIENLKSALKRDTKIYGEIRGVGSYFSPFRLLKYNPTGIGMRFAMESALKEAGITTKDIEYISCNANSTQNADLIETKAIKDLFGDYAYKIPVSSIKSTIGESYSASGGFGIATALGAINRNLFPPTMNYQEKDPECDLDYVINKTRSGRINTALVNSFDFNGFNSVAVLTSVKN